MLFDKRAFFPHSAEAAPTCNEENVNFFAAAASEGQNKANEIMSGKKNTPAT